MKKVSDISFSSSYSTRTDPTLFFLKLPNPDPTWIFAFQDSTIENSESGSIHLCNMPIKKCVVYYFKLYPLDILEAQILDIYIGLSLVVFI